MKRTAALADAAAATAAAEAAAAAAAAKATTDTIERTASGIFAHGHNTLEHHNISTFVFYAAHECRAFARRRLMAIMQGVTRSEV